jgi:hypothetical protein
MLVLLTLLAAFGGWRATRAIVEQLRRLPRSNSDFVFF